MPRRIWEWQENDYIWNNHERMTYEQLHQGLIELADRHDWSHHSLTSVKCRCARMGVRAVVAHPPLGKPVPVRCVETGTIYASMSEAGRAVHITASHISYAASTGATAGGRHWEKVTVEEVARCATE